MQTGQARRTFKPPRKDRDTELFLYYGFVKDPDQPVYFKWQAQTIIQILNLQQQAQKLHNTRQLLLLAKEDQFVDNEVSKAIIGDDVKIKEYEKCDHFMMVQDGQYQRL